MRTITFLLHTQQPILATSLQGDPNSDVSYPYIPGSMIRGVLISRYQKLYSPSETNILENDNVKRLFFNATTRYLNAYLFDRERLKRTLPVPMCLYKDKIKGLENVCDFSQIKVINRPDNFSPKRLEESFCIVEYGSLLLYSEKRRINIHNQRNRQKGKGIEGSGAVFRYDAIDTGQTFQAVVICDHNEDAEIIQSLLQGKNSEFLDVWLGGSQSAGYGHVKVELLTDEYDSDEWDELKISYEERSDRHKNLTITLLSDTILRDEWGQPSSNPERFTELISSALSIELKHIDTYASSKVVGGFNRKWGLPLPQTPALAAGSVFVFEIPQTQLKSQQVRNLEVQGIGERRAEGFGRIALNWLPENDSLYAEKVNLNLNIDVANFSISSPQEVKDLGKTIAQRILRQKLDELLLEEVSPNTPSNISQISNSQLSRLMILARQALTASSPDGIYELLGREQNSCNLPANARNQFERTNVNGMALDEQIRVWLKNPKIWILKAWAGKNSRLKNEKNEPTITIAKQPQSLNDELALEYTLRLIIAVTKKMMKKDKTNE
jgi:CRISPR-associated protein Csx10